MNKNDKRNAGTPTGQDQPPEQNVQPRREQKDVPGRDKQRGLQQGKTEAPGQKGTGQQENRPPQPR